MPVAEYPNITATSSAIPPIGQNGVIGGGILRPGAIDQTAFQEQLQAQYRLQNQGKAPAAPTGLTLADYRRLAGMPTVASAPPPTSGASPDIASAPQTLPSTTPAAPAGDGIPTLTLAQFAALTGITPPEPAPAAAADTPQTAELAPGDLAGSDPTGGDLMVVGAQNTDVVAAAIELADGVPLQTPAAEMDAEPDAATADAAKTDSRVVLLDTYPDRDEQRAFAAQGKSWRMKETPGARELFLGPDGEFGWDDFVDIINPLQHIPVVAQIYRAVTGDQAYGLSTFIGAAPFGPLSLASAVVDTVIRSQTGRDAGTDMAAMILGIDNRTPEEADLRLSPGYADQPDMAAADSAAIQVADASLQPARTEQAWTHDTAGIGRD
ncbi:hypothetical protein [Dongia mobilis]|uniref:hypothetical protein n=1 Tax=Dongia sp. TaxID=1977262 RepID=UPI0026F2BC91